MIVIARSLRRGNLYDIKYNLVKYLCLRDKKDKK